jgi:hypothetical protein
MARAAQAPVLGPAAEKELRRLIPKPVTRRFAKMLQSCDLYIRDTVTLPAVFSLVLWVFYIANGSFTVTMAGNTQLWSDSPGGAVIAQFFSLFWRFASLWSDETRCLISSLVVLVLYLVSIVPCLLAVREFKRNGRLSWAMCAWGTFSHDFFLHIILFWLAPQMGTVLFCAVKFNSGFWGLFIVMLLIVVFQIIYLHTLSYGQVIYFPIRHFTWLGRDMTVFQVLIVIGSFFSRMGEIFPEVGVRLTFMIISGLSVMVSVSIHMSQLPGVDGKTSLIWSALGLAGIVACLCKIMFVCGIEIGTQLILVVFLLLIVLFYTIISLWAVRREASAIRILDCLDASGYEQSFPRKEMFLRTIDRKSVV